jgi:peptidoglycan/xylan/chitin deacetylase (PgdA/CDA1 family)
VSILNGIRTKHGVMFHHFTDGVHPAGQGAISERQFYNIIHGLGIDTFLSADVWLDQYLSGNLKPGARCITFDDCLQCQFDVALPVLKRLGLRAMFFVYTAHLAGGMPRLEIYRYFRTAFFETQTDFYNAFFLKVESVLGKEPGRKLESISPTDFPYFPAFYTAADRRFQVLRDMVLSDDSYNLVMGQMLMERNVDQADVLQSMLMQKEQLKELHDQGHIIGLHSHTHPMQMSDLDTRAQEHEYSSCFNQIREITGSKPLTVSHPSNSYSDVTLKILSELGIEVGFRADIEKLDGGALELPRLDHTYCRLALGL